MAKKTTKKSKSVQARKRQTSKANATLRNGQDTLKSLVQDVLDEGVLNTPFTMRDLIAHLPNGTSITNLRRIVRALVNSQELTIAGFGKAGQWLLS